ncbi:MAG: bifunctional 5,10-methylenetetrahydrofolate dehydrogenase/5,10-methenyltetrahydrofolate cyclohydrolase [Defluviitaleaceae bacterium]|nr:bifunctional 5,10-methylenetetrahydrofolate dehydrogenase/5,10-methenyltetrahydrofolate cyclohydrolase [Defluviitaleaceae bacterium]MCL2837159.1 bifunctional 5,10-methylenetetrahydrofolate dehydrogenase/5,10-methenyltetrahydrofolate cyclohydrolase [Defluviitaleaceae bacterium]
MPAKIIDGKFYSSQILDEVRGEVAEIVKTGERPPCLAVVLVGEDPASAIYVNSKKKMCADVGITSRAHILPAQVWEETLLLLIDKLNEDGEVDGILVQSPLPGHIDEDGVFKAIAPGKDVDGFHPYNSGLTAMGSDGGLAPCTPAGCVELLRREGIPMAGANCVVIGRSNIVGRPAASLMIKESATVTVCHSKTKDLAAVTRGADILIAAIGKKNFVTPDMVKDGAVIVDVGINRTEGSKKIYGDVDPACMEKASRMTPVPGGVGPMTIAMLMKNCLSAYKMAREKEKEDE